MWTKPVSKLNWHDISTICPICDSRMVYGVNEAKCPNNHYEVSAGSYHVDFFVNGKHVATTDDMFNDAAHATLERVIPEVRKQWQEKII